MGSAGSLPNSLKSQSQEPPPLPPPFYTGNPQSGISRLSGSSCETTHDSRASRTSTVTLEPSGFRDSRSSASLKNEEWWHQRPSAPSLSSLRPQQETLLTYAAQMTGWQSGSASAVPSMHQEAMELARTVSHLAAANQQLASAHATLLSQLETLYHELNRERESRISTNRETRKRSCNSDEEDEKIKLAHRIANLEAAIDERTCNFGIRESTWREQERQFRASLEELENRLSSRNNLGEQSDHYNEELEFRLGASAIASDTENLGQSTGSFSKRRNFDVEKNVRRIQAEKNFSSSRLEDNVKITVDKNPEDNLNFEYQKALDRIQLLEDELGHSVRHCDSTGMRKDRIKPDNCRIVEEDDVNDWSSRSNSKSSDNEEDIQGLLEEIKRLKDERLEYQEINEKLTVDLERQKKFIETWRREYEVSRSQNEKVEAILAERKQQFKSLMNDFDEAKSETSRLMKELKVLNLEKETAAARIVDLERDLAQSALDKEQIVVIENQENSRLRKKLSDEVTSNRERAKGLEDALKEIQRLNEVIETGGKSENNNGGEATPEIESSPEEEVMDPEISVPRSSNMEEFRKELSLKREARQRAIAAVSSEMDRLRRELDAEKEAHSETSRVLDLLKSAQATNVVTREVNNPDAVLSITETVGEDDYPSSMKPDPDQSTNEADAQALTDILKVSDELRMSIRLQIEKIDDLRYHLECEPEGHENRISNLKEIASASREVSGTRERQINKLKNLLAQILARLGDSRFRVEITDDVRAEHDRQLEDIRRLKSLYDERLRVLVDMRDAAVKELTDVKDKLKCSRKENAVFEEDLRKAEEKIDIQDTEISNLESQLGLTKADCRDLQNQMSVINGLFTQMLLSASSADMDLDRLTRLLQENHDLISDMAREEGTEAAALPKLLLDLVEQVEGRGEGKSTDGETEKKEDGPQEENIAHNLPKVWRVLLELLSCHAVASPPVTPASLSTDPNVCYKSVDTPSGPRLVISVSKTYIRLKELILEKKHLEKEMNRMKQLNTHLESKLGEQEKRLSTVSSELSKTWNVVGRMQAQHQQLHTHEKILRYELQQKRKMLQELKQELEYCREKWESARQKNTNTEIEWRSLRREFAARKSLAAQDSFNNSGESGFSDERGDDSDEEDEAVEERVRIGPRRRARKENPRAPTPDTESEQPTDTEISESKTGSTASPDQRTPTPETVEPNEEVSITIKSADLADSADTTNAGSESQIRVKPINPLDRALANAIQSLITEDGSNANDGVTPIVESPTEDEPLNSCSSNCPEVEKISGPTNPIERLVNDNETSVAQPEEEESIKSTEELVSNSAVSVFSIGPFPTCQTLPLVKSVQFSDPLIVGPSTQPCTSSNSGEQAKDSTLKFDFPQSEDSMLKFDVSESEESALKFEVSQSEDSTLKFDVPQVEDSMTSVKAEELEKVSADVKPKVFEKTEIETIKSVTEKSEETSEASGITQVVDQVPEEIELPSTSTEDAPSKPARTHEEVLAARAARLKRLEEQADWLMKKMSATSRRGSVLNNRLEELHEVYGEAPVPPPMPSILTNARLPSDTDARQGEEPTAKNELDDNSPPDSP